MFSCCVPSDWCSCFRRPHSESFSRRCRHWFNPCPRHCWPFKKIWPQVTQGGLGQTHSGQATSVLHPCTAQIPSPSCAGKRELKGEPWGRNSFGGSGSRRGPAVITPQESTGSWRCGSRGVPYLCQWESKPSGCHAFSFAVEFGAHHTVCVCAWSGGSQGHSTSKTGH